MSFNYNDPNRNNNTTNSFSPRPEPNKTIDVTKPRPSEQYSNIDTSRVSEHTLREQASLEKLRRQMGEVSRKEGIAGKVKTIIAIILVLILIALAVFFVFFIGKNTTSEEQAYDIRVSMQIENKSSLSILTDTGREQLREINPGDIVPIKAYVRNSDEYYGDSISSDTAPPNIYVRFKLVLVLDYEERYDILIPTMTNLWYKYNKEEEDKIIGGAKEDDHYYYFTKPIYFQQRAELFSEIEFSGDAITCDDGGKYGQIQLSIEAIEASYDNLSHEIWPTAPERWRLQMMQGSY